MRALLDFLSEPAPRDIGRNSYDEIRRILDETVAELGPWDDEPARSDLED